MVSANFDFDDDKGTGEAPRWIGWPVLAMYGIIGGLVVAAILFGLR